MKKIILLIIPLLLASCGTNNQTEENPNISNSGNLQTENNDISAILPEGSFAYSGTLDVSGVGPDISFEAGIPNDTLALKWTNLEQSYTDHLFIDASLWKKFVGVDDFITEPADENIATNSIDTLTLPGNIVYFDGIIYPLEGAAGNHYYQVVEVYSLEKIGNPTKEKVQEIVDSYRYCEQDSDCSWFYGDCPFGCHQAVNTKYLNITQNVMKNWYNAGEPKCVYDCVAIEGAKCENYKCSAVQEERK